MRRQQPERQLQASIVQYLDRAGVPGLVYFAVPNQGKRKLLEAIALKRVGVKAGVPDLVLINPANGRFHGLELKVPGRTATEFQVQFQQDILAAGGCAAIAAGVDQAIEVLKGWGLVR